MTKIIRKTKFWTYLKGNFLYRVHCFELRKVIKCLLCIVLGALLLAGLYRLFDSVVIPRLETEIVNMFDYDGN